MVTIATAVATVSPTDRGASGRADPIAPSASRDQPRQSDDPAAPKHAGWEHRDAIVHHDDELRNSPCGTLLIDEPAVPR